MIRKLNEAAMEGFSVDQLKNIRSFNGRYQYCMSMLGKYIGKGSSRAVFQIDDEKVLKLAFNRKGLAQNEAEADWNMQNYGVVPTLYDVDDDYMFIISEFVLPSKKEDFQHCLGISFEEYQQFVIKVYNCYARRTMPTSMSNERYEELIENNEWLNGLYYMMADYQMPYGDIIRMSNIGLANRNGDAELVILDSGLSQEIWDEFYSR